MDEVGSPMGTILLVARNEILCALDFEDCRARLERFLRSRYEGVRLRPSRDPGGVTTRVRAYFDGEIDALERVTVETGGTPFQRRVWSALRRVRPGATTTYGEIARRVGRPNAARAVGVTNGRNPVALAVPCHRVIGADGSLTGYAGGIHRKRWLLQHEGVTI